MLKLVRKLSSIMAPETALLGIGGVLTVAGIWLAYVGHTKSSTVSGRAVAPMPTPEAASQSEDVRLLHEMERSGLIRPLKALVKLRRNSGAVVVVTVGEVEVPLPGVVTEVTGDKAWVLSPAGGSDDFKVGTRVKVTIGGQSLLGLIASKEVGMMVVEVRGSQKAQPFGERMDTGCIEPVGEMYRLEADGAVLYMSPPAREVLCSCILVDSCGRVTGLVYRDNYTVIRRRL